MIVYLCGPIAGLSYQEATGWRLTAEEVLSKWGVKTLDPMRHKEELRNETAIQPILDGLLTTPSAIVSRDYFDVKRCDLILASLHGRPSVGTTSELAWAYQMRKPVIAVVGALWKHPFIDQFVKVRCECMDDALMAVRKFA